MASENARSLSAGIAFVACDLSTAIAPASVDLIVSNPPYVPRKHRDGLQREVRDWEPEVALFGGESGFDLYDRILADAPRILRPDGWLILELGFGCHEHVGALLALWRDLRLVPDLAGIPRVAAARRP